MKNYGLFSMDRRGALPRMLRGVLSSDNCSRTTCRDGFNFLKSLIEQFSFHPKKRLSIMMWHKAPDLRSRHSLTTRDPQRNKDIFFSEKSLETQEKVNDDCLSIDDRDMMKGQKKKMERHKGTFRQS